MHASANSQNNQCRRVDDDTPPGCFLVAMIDAHAQRHYVEDSGAGAGRGGMTQRDRARAKIVRRAFSPESRNDRLCSARHTVDFGAATRHCILT